MGDPKVAVALVSCYCCCCGGAPQSSLSFGNFLTALIKWWDRNRTSQHRNGMIHRRNELIKEDQKLICEAGMVYPCWSAIFTTNQECTLTSSTCTLTDKNLRYLATACTNRIGLQKDLSGDKKWTEGGQKVTFLPLCVHRNWDAAGGNYSGCTFR